MIFIKAIDLTHKLENNMPVYSEPNRPNIKKVATIEDNGYEESFLSMYSHNGTHIDSTKHMYAKGTTLDLLDINNFLGKGIIVEVKDKIDIEDLKAYEEEINNCDFIIFKSGWENYWGKKEYYENYPLLTEKAAKYIVDSNIKGIGMDMLSVDSYDSSDFKIHQILFEGKKLIVENLANLDSLPSEFTFIAAPLKFNDADGSPVRAMAIVN